MADPVDALILDLLEWLAPRPRPYAEVMEAWRTSCPRLPVWEDANDRGLLERGRCGSGDALVGLTPAGRELLRLQRRISTGRHTPA
jgi:D-3-phosphoglycerate dehydrogenase